MCFQFYLEDVCQSVLVCTNPDGDGKTGAIFLLSAGCLKLLSDFLMRALQKLSANGVCRLTGDNFAKSY